MQQQLINLNPDLKRLFDEGYVLEVHGGYLLIHHVPYLNPSQQVKYGTLVCELTLAGVNRVSRPRDHTISFIGEIPCNAGGTPMTAVINNSTPRRLTENIVVNHLFSSKPSSGNYADYYDKIRTYSEILSAQAKVIDPSVTCKPNPKKAA